MSFISDEIRRVEERLLELQSALDEAEQLKTVLENLKKTAAAPKPHVDMQPSSKRAYFSEAQRVEQIRRYQDQHPDASKADIARAIGVTPARVSQLSDAVNASRASVGSPKPE